MAEVIVWICGRRPAERPTAIVVHDVVATEELAKAFLAGVSKEEGLEFEPDFHQGDDGERSWRLEGAGQVWTAEWFAVRGTG